MLLCKGFEIEMYTGTPQGNIVGLSDKIVKKLDGFVREPDSRNVEYTTAPYTNYDRILCALLKPRQKLRNYVSSLGNYTIIPGSTLSLGGSDRFYRSDPNNPYHAYIEDTYGTDVVTASVHINIGISDPEKLLQACRLIRMEAPLFLALSASSPFLDGKATGFHSTRWQMFPKTPSIVPLFTSHNHFIHWTQEQLATGTMRNVRHLWSSVRPNGDNRPYNLNRLELRICDLIIDPIALLAITALLEARISQILARPTLDPLQQSRLSSSNLNAELIAIADKNELAVARNSLDAELQHWEDGRTIKARDWIEAMYQEVFPIAKQQGYSCFLLPLKKILREGNQAQQWLELYQQGQPIPTIIEQAIANVAQQEQDLESKLCQPILVA
ncbi:MAG: glutamate--cysteine ligase [Xenococcaceae cyanobacterium MO_207.B15]|nr:glutamate--cysteine ligase [Xenococcaceae cyanobacterium MO_207.B15]